MKGSAGSTKARTAPAISMRPRMVETKPSVTRQTDSKASRPLPKKGIDSSSPEPTATPEMAPIAPSAEAIRSWPKPARSAMGLPLSAMTTESRSMNSKRPATRPPSPPPAAGSVPVTPAPAAKNTGCQVRDEASAASRPFTAAAAGGDHSSRLGSGRAASGTLCAAAWKRPVRDAMVLKNPAAASQEEPAASSATARSSASLSSEAARPRASSSTAS